MWRIVFTNQAQKDAAKIKSSGLKPKVEELLSIIAANPFVTPPSFEKLRGDLLGLFSRRINIHHRIVYQVYSEEKVVKIIRMWTHYE